MPKVIQGFTLKVPIIILIKFWCYETTHFVRVQFQTETIHLLTAINNYT